MFAGKGQDARKLLIFHWSDGSRDPFWADKDVSGFIEWKLNKYPDLVYDAEETTVAEYNAKYIFSDGQN
jgi:hypothetical protein